MRSVAVARPTMPGFWRARSREKLMSVPCDVIVIEAMAEAEDSAGDQQDFERSIHWAVSTCNAGLVSRGWAS
jgi:hypothetical protein